jgi:transcriptional regulator with GAF, ATPase, and Fis domain
LRLIFTCCHPALALEAQVALTLKTLCGLSVEEIARAFLVAPAAVAERLVRAEARIRAAGVPYAVPTNEELAERVAAHDTTVLLTGESGTGKEVVARAIHRMSPRSAGPFTAINCAAIPEHLLESELFGHMRGAFTGAVSDRSGIFESTNGGTLMLDEIGELPLGLQAKLLRVLEEGEIRRLGGRDNRAVDVRVTAATAKDLERAVEEGQFRDDLYYRINVVRLHVPPLRERPADVPALVAHFAQAAAEKLGRAVSLTPRALAALAAHAWPGNVRELRNAI